MTGAGLLAMGIGLMWSLVFPLNKALWTSSYVWFTAGAAAVFLALCYTLIDVKGWKAWSRPFVILGLNAIALFVLSGLMTKFLSFHKVAGPDGSPISLLRYIYTTWFVPLASPINASLLFALANLAVLFVVMWLMDRKGIYLKA
jgi:predicted acyltransferase